MTVNSAEWDANRYEWSLKQSTIGRNNSVLDISRHTNTILINDMTASKDLTAKDI